MTDVSSPNTFRAANGRTVSARVACTEHERVEFFLCGTNALVPWNVARPEVSLMWVRHKGSNAQITVDGRQADAIVPRRDKLWLFPEGIGAEGELIGNEACDCAGVFVNPAFLLLSANQLLAQPIARFLHEALGRAFSELRHKLGEPDELSPLFTEGFAMRALAYVARASHGRKAPRSTVSSGLGALAA